MARAILWVGGLSRPDGAEARVKAIGPTRFDVVVLPFLHTREGGRLHFDDVPLDRLWCGLPDALAELKGAFRTRRSVLMSLGPSQADYDHIDDLGEFVEAFGDFASRHHVDGLDLAYQGAYDAEHIALLARLVAACKARLPRVLVTATPRAAEEFWAGRDGVLSRTGRPGGNLVDWFSTQFFAGSANLPPDQYATAFQSWVATVGQPGNAVADPAAFLHPGCSAGDGFTPRHFQHGLRALRRRHPSLGGGSVWSDGGAGEDLDGWGRAISRALP